MTLRDDLNHEKLMHKVFEQNANELLIRAELSEKINERLEEERLARIETIEKLEQRAEAAEARAVTFAETIETLVNEKAQAEQERDGYKEAAHDWHMNYLDAIAKRDELRAAYLGSLKTIEELRRQLEQAKNALREIKEILAVGRNVSEDKQQAYQDAEEIADFSIEAQS